MEGFGTANGKKQYFVKRNKVYVGSLYFEPVLARYNFEQEPGEKLKDSEKEELRKWADKQ